MTTTTLDYGRSTPARRLASDLGLLLLRLPIGVLFVFGGHMKIFTMGVRKFVEDATKFVPPYLPPAVGKGYLYCVPFAELLVGICLVLGLLTRFIGLITALMLLSFMMAVTGWKDPQGGPFNASVAYFSVALALMLLGAGRISIDALIPRRRGKSEE
jgi:uncharacterized membrane protein YphA (DoxX/SURF4 family)